MFGHALEPDFTRLLLVDSDGVKWEIAAIDLHLALECDPGLRVLPPADPNELLLSPEDYAFLRSQNIGISDRREVPRPFSLLRASHTQHGDNEEIICLTSSMFLLLATAAAPSEL